MTAPANLYTYVLGMKYPAQGIAGGKNGSPNKLMAKVGGPGEYHVTHTATYVPIDAGERIEYYWAGGAGWGDPLERDPEKVREDVLDEYVSIESAIQDYGVVLKGSLEDYTLEVDVGATEKLRREKRTSS
jgi:N-methylhydantoinase B